MKKKSPRTVIIIMTAITPGTDSAAKGLTKMCHYLEAF